MKYIMFVFSWQGMTIPNYNKISLKTFHHNFTLIHVHQLKNYTDPIFLKLNETDALYSDRNLVASGLKCSYFN